MLPWLNRRPASAGFPPPLTWAPVVLDLAVMYVPRLVDLFRGMWSTPELGHGSMVLGASVWLLYRQWPALQAAALPHLAEGRTQPSAWSLATPDNLVRVGQLKLKIGRRLQGCDMPPKASPPSLLAAKAAAGGSNAISPIAKVWRPNWRRSPT